MIKFFLRVIAAWAAFGLLTLALSSQQTDLSSLDNWGRPNAPHSPAAVLAEHDEDCWSGGETALEPWPKHVIYQRPNGFTVYRGGRQFMTDAINTALGVPPKSRHLPGRVIAFCR